MQIEPNTQVAHQADSLEMSRRTLLRGAAVAGVATVTATSLAACGGEEQDSGTATAEDGGAAGALVATSEIPVGGGRVVDTPDGKKIVITQPLAGEFKAFDATCTHQGCTVNEISNDVISCPCHGSKYSADDGSVERGPATKPLAGVNITVAGTEIKLG